LSLDYFLGNFGGCQGWFVEDKGVVLVSNDIVYPLGCVWSDYNFALV
jgi:hypothetical protein